jgi:ABC-type Fe3+-hydroxamate transport system substrate-binding protein
MTIGGDTFINDMLQRCGFVNVFAGRTRYPEITIEDLQAAQCELLLLSSEPFPFKERHIKDWEARLPGTRVLLADGEMFSWYGSRLLLAPEYFGELIQNIQ